MGQALEDRELAERARVDEQAGRLFGLVNPRQYDNDLWLYTELISFIKARVDLEDERHYELLASCVLHSFRARDNRTTPYLFVTGPTGTGKNRILHLMRALCQRGLIAGNPTPASLYRVMDTHHPTLCIDEGEKLAPYKKNQSESTLALLEVLNLGYCQDQYVLRADKDTRALKEYDPYGFKVIASTETLPDTLLGRSVVITTEENIRTDIPVAFEREEAKTLRECLEWYGTIHDPKTPLYQKPTIEGLGLEQLKLLIPNYRVVEIFGPLFKVTPDPKAQKHILELAQEASEDRREERGTGQDAQVLEALLKTRQSDPEPERYPIAAITKFFNENLEKWETKTNDWIGKRIRKFSLKPCRVGEKNVHGIIWNEKKLLRRFKRYGLLAQDAESTSLPNTTNTSNPSKDSTLSVVPEDVHEEPPVLRSVTSVSSVSSLKYFQPAQEDIDRPSEDSV